MELTLNVRKVVDITPTVEVEYKETSTDKSLTLGVEKEGANITPSEQVINEEFALDFGYIFRGLTAYEQAVRGGFEGTEEEFEAYVGGIGRLSEEAKNATNEAKTATDNANKATTKANASASRATLAANDANDATDRVEEKITLAHEAISEAIAVTNEARDAIEEFEGRYDDFVLKEKGKGLSTNDYTNSDKAEVAKVATKVGYAEYDNNRKAIVYYVDKDKSSEITAINIADFVKEVELSVAVTYAELKSLRDAKQLVPGMKYRITDYVTTTTQTNTQSAGHQFDIIVTALDTDTLSEEASAIHHEGDTYFASSDLAAWKVWYSLDADTKYSWVTGTNHKGVIYRLVDEYRNDCLWDFKNIQFKNNNVWYYTFGTSDSSLSGSSYDNVIYVTNSSKLPIIIFKGATYLNRFHFPLAETAVFGNVCAANTITDTTEMSSISISGQMYYCSIMGVKDSLNLDGRMSGVLIAGSTGNLNLKGSLFYGEIHGGGKLFVEDMNGNSKPLRGFRVYFGSYSSGIKPSIVLVNNNTTSSASLDSNLVVDAANYNGTIDISPYVAEYSPVRVLNIAKDSTGEIKIWCEADSEEWTFTLTDGSTITKNIVVR